MKKLDLRKNRQKLIPWVKNWSDAHNYLRYGDVSKMRYHEWFWFHPSAYKIISISTFLLAGLLFSSAGYMSYVKGYPIGAILFGIFAALMFRGLYRTIKFIKIHKHISYFDMMLRDTEVNEDGL